MVDPRLEQATATGLAYKLLPESLLHSAAEGVAIGVAMVVELKLEIFVALALAVHSTT